MADEFDANSKRFLVWLSENGSWVSASIDLVDLRQRSAGRGVVATKDIAEDEALFSIPRELVLLPTNSNLSPIIFEAVENDPWLSLIITMLHEYALGPDSRWSHYFGVLPSSFDTPMFWTDGELAELQASPLTKKLGKAQADETFRVKLVPIVKEQLPTSSFFKDDAEILALSHRMASTIMAYAFDIEPPVQEVDDEGFVSDEDEEALPKGMVPMADMLNADAHRNNARLFYEDDKLVMKSIQPIKAGDEIFNDYGELPRSDLLRRYGYVTSNYKQYDVIEIPSHTIFTSWCELFEVADLEERVAYLEEHDAIDDAFDLSHPDPALTQPSERFLPMMSTELRMLISALALSTEEFASLKVQNKLPKQNAPPSKIISKTMAEMLKSSVNAVSAKYSTSLSEDRKLQEEGVFKDSIRKSMALEVRVGEKEILEVAAATLQEIIDDNTNQEDNGMKDQGQKQGEETTEGEGKPSNKRRKLK
ncbi:SET domain-containing protein [Rhizodiscina lignyota]|uniref:Ribosomal lysine N-methyltransferase 4 n=1 Tax=Rhizodiscina lignyota TaxID=1504668 RepID=A0A9P4M2U3_9PEZI|nr:SET domain-containing protein [Rhizodiscina lignyota]